MAEWQRSGEWLHAELPASGQDRARAAAFALPIPLGAPIGLRFFAQSAWLQPEGAACGTAVLSLVSSRGVAITIRP